jgi:hypothetical protein
MAISLADLFVSSKQTQGTPSLASGGEGQTSTGTIDTLFNYFGRGADIYTAVTGKNTPVVNQIVGTVPVNTPGPAAAPAKSYTLYIIGGLIALGVIFWLVKK